VGKDQLSIHFTRLLDDLKSSKHYCPRNLFSGSNSFPEKSSPEKSSRFLSRKLVLRPALIPKLNTCGTAQSPVVRMSPKKNRSVTTHSQKMYMHFKVNLICYHAGGVSLILCLEHSSCRMLSCASFALHHFFCRVVRTTHARVSRITFYAGL